MNTTTNPYSTEAEKVTDQAADEANSAIRSTQTLANGAFDRLSEKVEDVRNQAVPLLNRFPARPKRPPSAAPMRCATRRSRSVTRP